MSWLASPWLYDSSPMTVPTVQKIGRWGAGLDACPELHQSCSARGESPLARRMGGQFLTRMIHEIVVSKNEIGVAELVLAV